ncbi:YybH family protein [Sphingomonas bacterium]|uniref:YybH family protein n=1 Tax=Sphingomonas bacterium TaxID=1895847 RepID=UPI001575CAD6|nr:SgcJ/EcaC family oxidoreductase [Sphingomonas bacterium]
MRWLTGMTLIAAAPALAPVQSQLMTAMEASAAGWNAGDLDRFMAVYADDATYVTKDGVLRGKAAITAHYRASFADGGNLRGQLSFEPVAFRTLGPAQQLMIARWRLTGGAAGMTTLVWERRPAGWRIVADHSS